MYHEKLTQKDVERLQEEIDHRKLVVRKEAIEAVKEARAQGDLSENFEYYAAKRDKNKNESRIRYLERMIKNAEIITDDSREDEVGLNNTVQLYMEEDDETETYKPVSYTHLRHFIRLRGAKAAHPQIREITRLILKEFQERYPLFFEDLTAE